MTFVSNPPGGLQTSVDSLSVGSTAVAPGAGASFAILAAPPAGVYEVRCAVFIGTGKVAADDGNAVLKKGAATILASVPTNGAEQVLDRVTLDGASQLLLNTGGAGTAGVPYTGRITVTRIE